MSWRSPAVGVRPGMQLVLVSFAALFLELMVIRWVPSSVRVVAYFANLMLISSFLGLGLGAMLSGRNLRSDRWFPFALIALVLLVHGLREVTLPGSPAELRFFAGDATLANYAALIAIFTVNTAAFVPLGERLGRLFGVLPPLVAYAYDLVGSLLGTVCFGIFAYRYFSPTAGMLAAVAVWAVAVVLLGPSGRRALPAALAVAASGVIVAVTPADGVWSPYYFIRVEALPADGRASTEPPPALRTMTDPPIYQLKVNHDFYQLHGSIDPQRYTRGSELWSLAGWLQFQFTLPYAIATRADRVLVVGAGGGMDVEAALRAGVRRVDAVEIDPVIIELAHAYNAADPYRDPRVVVHNDDARAFFQRARASYDLIVFGFLDSQALFHSMSNVRLDGFVYTVESLRRAHERLAADGLLVLSFATGEQGWLMQKLGDMLERATGTRPVVYSDGGRQIFVVPKGAHKSPPQRYGTFVRLEATPPSAVPPATDDWPYLYLMHRGIPRDYLVVIGVLSILSVAGVMVVKPRGMGFEGVHFLLLGLGFLLLETSSIVSCGLYFGTTWLVTMVVVAGVLLMVLLANMAVLRFRLAGLGWYVPLFASLLLVYLLPRANVLELPFAGRLAWTLLAIPLPVFFAGVIFSSTFRVTGNPPAMLGLNLIGATLGGFAEYLGMLVGHGGLAYVVVGAYAGSLVCRGLARER
jgi:hypothetical protein